LTSYVDSVQQFEDYENALEVRQTITPLGWGHSEKDGLYVGRTEFAIGYSSLSKVLLRFVNNVNIYRFLTLNNMFYLYIKKIITALIKFFQ
jgi:hypothetical protein